MANDKDFVVNGPVVVGKDTKVTVGSIGSAQEGYYLAGAAYASKSFSVASQAPSPREVQFNNDGTKMYVIDNSNDSTFQYSLSTAFDVSTASYDSVSFSVASQATAPQGFNFNNDGTKMYVVGEDNDTVYQYTLSTGFDLSSASYDSVSFSVASQETAPSTIVFNNDGTKMYICGEISDAVHQYSLSTGFDLSTASYDSVSFDFSSQATQVLSMAFSGDGTKMFLSDAASDTIYQYSLSTGFIVSTASYDSVSFDVSPQDGNPHGIAFSSTGDKLFLLGSTSSADTVYQYSTVLTTSSVDLSTGNYFTDSPSGDYTYTFANAGDVQAFQIEATGGSDAVAETFSTTLYTGTGAAKTISNGLDLANDGGLVWTKKRNGTVGHRLVDTERGVQKSLRTEGTDAEAVNANGLTAFNSDGYSIGGSGSHNAISDTYVSWSFKKQTKFFDVVTYTGTGVAGRTVSHNLGSVPGMIIVKQTDTINNWLVQHIAFGGSHRLQLNSTDAAQTASVWNNTDPTSTVFTVGANTGTNASGGTYVAYLFAHDTASDGLIQCGSYTGNGSTDGPEINLGWQPQWVLIKAATRPAGENWVIYDAKRGLVVDAGDPALFPNDSAAEDYGGSADNSIDPLPTGFKIVGTSGRTNDSYDYIYMAIRSAAAPAITWPSSIEWTAGSTPSTPAEGETDVYTFTTDDGGTTYTGIQSIDNAS